MQFQICGEVFTVVVVDNLVRDGELCDGYFEPDTKRVLISTLAPDRKRTLFHELRHAWVFSLGQRGIDPETDAIDVAAFADVVSQQLDDQGGPARLLSLRPKITRGAETDSKVIIRDRMECKCGCVVMIGDIHTGAPEYSQTIGMNIVDRWMDCEVCGSVTLWKETAAENGIPLGQVLPTPVVLRDARRRAWLRERMVTIE